MVKTKKKSNSSKKYSIKAKGTIDEFNIKFLKKNEKLFDIDKLMNLYDKLLNYMKKLNNTNYEELKNKIDKRKIKEKKLNLLKLIIDNQKGNNNVVLDTYVPKNKPEIILKNSKCFKDCKIIDTLGQGAFGITYLVEKNKKNMH